MLPACSSCSRRVDRRPNRAQGGLGIGLTLVKSLVEMHGGSVQAQQSGVCGRGSEFVVRLPLSADRPQPTSTPRCRPVPGPRSRRVLVVDDNRDAAESLGMLLNCSVRTCTSSTAAPTLSKSSATFRPAVVLLDIGMPGMDGHEVARRIRGTELQDVTPSR